MTSGLRPIHLQLRLPWIIVNPSPSAFTEGWVSMCIAGHLKGISVWIEIPNGQGKRRRSRPLDRKVRPEGQKGALSLEEGRGPRKTAGPRKRRSAASMIAGSACCTSAGRQKGLKTPWKRQSAEISGCAHRAGDGTNALVNRRQCEALTSELNRQLGR